MIVTVLLTSMTVLACGATAAGFVTETAQRGEFKEREEINQTYPLSPGARVEVSSIRGPVEIVTGESATAEVQIIRTARTRADLEYHKIEVETTANSLVIRGVQEPQERQRQNIQVNHHVILKLPRRIDLSVKSISGSLKVGDVVMVSVDGGDWRPAQLADASNRGWQRFALSWVPSKCAAATLASRASSARGECQPESGRRNAIYRVPVTVV